MEDEYLINQNGAFAAVFDGHGGNAVSRYLRQNLYANVQAAAPVSTVEECVTALKAALKKVDREVQRISHWSFQGSTAVAVWVVSEDRVDEEPKRTVIAANVGDSRAVMCRNGEALDLTVDHKPNTAAEKARVEALGGKVVWCGMVDEDGKPVPNAGIHRVNGNLALSRAIGDRSERPAVTSKPDMTTFDVEDDDEFIILASDGLWDVMSSQEAISFVRDTLRESGPVLEGSSKASSDSEIQEDETESESEPASTNLQNRIADLLVAEALKRGTTDNVTVVVLWLNLKTV
jgi:serine/threonine protein phosphatase PrpC